VISYSAERSAESFIPDLLFDWTVESKETTRIRPAPNKKEDDMKNMHSPPGAKTPTLNTNGTVKYSFTGTTKLARIAAI
jgi:hypothetical protein